MKLITVGNPKTRKGQAKNWLTGIIHLSPSTISGRDVCEHATRGRDGCVWSCLNTSGHGGIGKFQTNTVQRARKARTDLWFEDRPYFYHVVLREIEALQRKADREGMRLAIRPNGTSDILELGITLADLKPDVQFYDYTKRPFAHFSNPSNYHLTFSWSGSNGADCVRILNQGDNVVGMVEVNTDFDDIQFGETHLGTVGSFATEPSLFGVTTVNSYPVFDADRHDLRFLDATESGDWGKVGLLQPKGKGKLQSFPGFAGQHQPEHNRVMFKESSEARAA